MEVFHTDYLSEREFEQILSVLRAGGVIGFPTDTAYGLGADPFNEVAVSRIFHLKGRPETKPILLLVDSIQMTESLTNPTPLFRTVAQAFWPGPLTIVLPARNHVPATVTAGTNTVGVRWPLAPFATRLVKGLGGAVTATSANASGQPACVTSDEVRHQLGDSLALMIDGGILPERGGSTILDLSTDVPTVLREGPVSFAALEGVCGGSLKRVTA